jgi:limonene-1,2-epoxide hydrolase
VANANEALLERLYAALNARNGADAAACYATDASFSDPVFPDLRGAEPGAMWRMLAERSSDLSIELLERSADGERGSSHWCARYTFSQTGRRVVNDIRGSFRFVDGLIAEHRDDFDFYKWRRQALGPTGLLLGWSPPIKSAVRRRARVSLDEFLARDADARK